MISKLFGPEGDCFGGWGLVPCSPMAILCWFCDVFGRLAGGMGEVKSCGQGLEAGQATWLPHSVKPGNQGHQPRGQGRGDRVGYVGNGLRDTSAKAERLFKGTFVENMFIKRSLQTYNCAPKCSVWPMRRVAEVAYFSFQHSPSVGFTYVTNQRLSY